MALTGELKDIRQLRRKLSSYTEPILRRSLFELFITVVLFCFFWILSYQFFSISSFLMFVFSLPAGVFLTRLFIIQHDCGHGSFFKNKKMNDYVGRVIGVVTLTPYYVWKKNHAVHHATSGNLDKRGVGDVNTLTTTEYWMLNFSGRLAYKIYRNPFPPPIFLTPIFFIFHHYSSPPYPVKRPKIFPWGWGYTPIFTLRVFY